MMLKHLSSESIVVRPYLEASWTPIDELNGLFCFDGQYRAVDVFRYDVSSVQQTDGHVFAKTRIAAHHLIFRFEARISHVRNGVLLMKGLISGYDWRERDQRKVDSRVRNQVGLEFVEIDVQSTVEAQRRGDRRDHLSDELVQITVGGSFYL